MVNLTTKWNLLWGSGVAEVAFPEMQRKAKVTMDRVKDGAHLAALDARLPMPENVSYVDALAALIASEDLIRKTCQEHMSPKAITSACLFGFGVGHRALAVSSGFRTMVEQQNSLCALPLVRMHLDTLLRLYAGFWAANHQSFCHEVLMGAQINRMKDADGHKMTDRFLVDKLTTRNPWVADVYKQTSGYIHFSGRHIRSVMRMEDLGSGDILHGQLVIGPKDYNRQQEDFCESIRCVHHLNLILDFALKDWFIRMCRPDGHIPDATEIWGDYEQQPES